MPGSPPSSAAIKFVPDRLGEVRIVIRAAESRTTSLGMSLGSKYRDRGIRTYGASPSGIGTDPISSRTLASGLVIGSFEPGTLSRSTSGHVPSPSAKRRHSTVDTPPAQAPHSNGCIGGLSRVLFAGARVARSCFQALGLAQAPPVLPREATGASLRAVSIHPVQPLAEPDQLIPFDVPRSAVSSPHVVDIPDGIAPTPTVTVVRFEVQDNGRGLSVEQCAQLFKPYAQVRDTPRSV